MKKIVLFFLFASCSGIGFSQKLTTAELLADLEYLKDTLPVKHTNLFAKTSKADFEKRINAIRSKIGTLTNETFTAELFKLTVAIGDEHTRIEPHYTKVLPIRFDFFEEGIFVTGIDSANAQFLLYRLEAIDGHPVKEIIARFREVIQSYNRSYFETGLLHFLNNPAFLKGLGLADNDQEVEYDLVDKNQNKIKLGLKARTGKIINNMPLATSHTGLLARQQQGNYWYDYDSARSLVYFHYAKCWEEKDKPFQGFSEALQEVIIRHHPQKLVVDLRYNSGGNSGILNPFIEWIKNSYLNKKNHLFVLVGKETFSSAVMNAIEFKRNTQAILVGEPTSGNINHYGETRGFSLPHTHIVIGYSTRYWENWKGKKGPLTPDKQARYTAPDFEQGKDAALEYIYQQR